MVKGGCARDRATASASLLFHSCRPGGERLRRGGGDSGLGVGGCLLDETAPASIPDPLQRAQSADPDLGLGVPAQRLSEYATCPLARRSSERVQRLQAQRRVVIFQRASARTLHCERANRDPDEIRSAISSGASGECARSSMVDW